MTKPSKSRLGRRSRRKGLQGERSFELRMEKLGIPVERTFMSGAKGGSQAGDIRLPTMSAKAESKFRATSKMRVIRRELDKCDLLRERVNNLPTLYVFTEELAEAALLALHEKLARAEA